MAGLRDKDVLQPAGRMVAAASEVAAVSAHPGRHHHRRAGARRAAGRERAGPALWRRAGRHPRGPGAAGAGRPGGAPRPGRHLGGAAGPDRARAKLSRRAAWSRCIAPAWPPQHASDAEIAAIRATLDDGEAAVRDNDQAALAAMDEAFHVAVAAASGNRTLAKMVVTPASPDRALLALCHARARRPTTAWRR